MTHQLGDDPDAEPGDALGERSTEVRDRSVDARGIHAIPPGDGLEQHDRVRDGPRERPDLVERRGECDEAVAGHDPVGGLHPDDAGQRGGLTDRTPGVTPEGAEGRTHGDGRSRTTG